MAIRQPLRQNATRARQGTPDPTADKDWYDQEFPYYDENGQRVIVSVSQILELASKAARYDDDRRVFLAMPPAPPEKAVEPQIVHVGAIQPALALGTQPFVKPLTLAPETRPKLMTALADHAGAPRPSSVLLRIEGIKPPKEAHLVFEVFVTKKGEKPSKAS